MDMRATIPNHPYLRLFVEEVIYVPDRPWQRGNIVLSLSKQQAQQLVERLTQHLDDWPEDEEDAP